MCNCKKQPKVETPYPIIEPIQVPQPPVVQDDWYNNIDTIEPIKTENNG
jgi:hypothetical protein